MRRVLVGAAHVGTRAGAARRPATRSTSGVDRTVPAPRPDVAAAPAHVGWPQPAVHHRDADGAPGRQPGRRRSPSPSPNGTLRLGDAGQRRGQARHRRDVSADQTQLAQPPRCSATARPTRCTAHGGERATGKSARSSSTVHHPHARQHDDAVPQHDRSGRRCENGATYGVGMVPVVPLRRADHATRRPPSRRSRSRPSRTSHGAWYWIDDQNVHWRPQDLLQARHQGHRHGQRLRRAGRPRALRPGRRQSTSFKIGAEHISIADDTTHMVKVYFNGKLRADDADVDGPGRLRAGHATASDLPLDDARHLHRDRPREPGDRCPRHSYGLPANSPLRLRAEKIYFATQDQHRRHLPARARHHGLGAGQRRRLARLPEPQLRQRAAGTTRTRRSATSSRS